MTGITGGSAPLADDTDSFVARLTLEGDFQWLTRFGTPKFDATWKVGVAGPTIFVGGNTQGQFDGETAFDGQDAFVAAFGRDGAFEWARQFGTSGLDNVVGLAADDEGAVAVGVVGGLSPGQGPASDAFARRYDHQGNVRWALQFPGGAEAEFDNAQDVALEDEDVYIVGATDNALGDADPGGRDGFVMRIPGDIEDDE